MSAQKPTILYIYDVLCGWCYGFSPVIQAFANERIEEFSFQVLSGGMVRGDAIGPIGEKAAYLHQAYRDVEERTGVTFGKGFIEGILAPGKAVMSSILGAQAMSVFREKKPEHVIEFAGALQKAIYDIGISPLNLGAYAKVATLFGLEEEEFLTEMQEEKVMDQVLEEFSMVANLGVQGFPMVMMENNGQWFILCRGYVGLDELNQAADRALQA